MARKKIVFVIVEGPSDEEALGVIFSRIYDLNSVYVHIMHGDITSDRGSSASNILSKMGNELKRYASANHYGKSDFKEIIHIVDMDGAYVSNACVMQSACEKPSYSLSAIRTANPNGIIQRNLQKSSILNKLRVTPQIWSVPYHVFYMSCNLDHVLYDKLNSSDKEKEADSYRFAKAYKTNIPAFVAFICDSDFSVTSGYLESWDFIKQDENSLHRHTNLGLCFQDPSTMEEPPSEGRVAK